MMRNNACVLLLGITAAAVSWSCRTAGCKVDYWAQDRDGDGFGDDATRIEVCGNDKDPEGEGWTSNVGDCDDSNPAVHPDATEVCDGIDNDCSHDTGEVGAIDAVTYFEDFDGDGAGSDKDPGRTSCTPIPGTVDNDDDCDDWHAAVGPHQVEIPGNGIDDDCDPATSDT